MIVVASEVLWVAQTNTYVVAAAPGGPAIVVDAPPDPAAISDLLLKHDLTPVAILLTHGHVDHAGGAGAVSRAHAVSAYSHPDDDFLTLDPQSQLQRLFGLAPPGDFAPPDLMLELVHGQTLDLAGLSLEVVHTPGHTPGHCCFHLGAEGVLFSGDQLFAGSIGRTDLPGGNIAALASSMRERVMTLADDTRVLPGHGPETTIARERGTNPFRELWEASLHRAGGTGCG
jgi:glyoxylase-like metal-dependent hydrolase (beta-lactamase superfamily II)